jgi:hypothetical protein
MANEERSEAGVPVEASSRLTDADKRLIDFLVKMAVKSCT